MVDKIEMSLDDIIKTGRSQRPRRGGGVYTGGVLRRGSMGARNGTFPTTLRGGGTLMGRNRAIQRPRGDVNNTWKHDLYSGPNRASAFSGPVKLMISNLDYGVSESDIRELFADFGALKKASVHYDRSGRSLGTADVTFERRADAVKAIKQYNGVPLDGRPMNIQLATSDVPILTNRVRNVNRVPIQKRPYATSTPFRGRGGARRGGSDRGTGPVNRGRGPGPTAEELDAELDAYVNDTK